MKRRQMNFIGFVLLLILAATQINLIFAGTTTQYQIYRLSDDPSDDRRPKLAINDQGTVWVVWESDRDGDFDVYGKKFENDAWSGLIEVTRDSVNTFLNDILFDREGELVVFETRTDSMYGIVKIIGTSFYKTIEGDSTFEKKYLCNSTFFNPLLGSYELTPGEPKAIFFDEKAFICYHRSQETDAWGNWEDSLFIRQIHENILSSELCDTIFSSWKASPYGNKYRFPFQRIQLKHCGLFLIKNYNSPGYYPYPWDNQDIGIVISGNYDKKYILLSYNIGEYGHGIRGIDTYCYGATTNSVFVAGQYVQSNKKIIRELDIDVEKAAVSLHEWRLNYNSNITISQMSDLVAFAWIDSSILFIKTFQDSTWYETQKIPLDNLRRIGLRFHCSVYENRLIWISFDAISNGNKDVYALSVPASFVVDTVLTSVKQGSENSKLPNEFALFQNYPNPFNSSTEIKYSLSNDRLSYYVTLKIYDIRGRLVNTLVEQNQAAGMYAFRWHGTGFDGSRAASGVYFCELRVSVFKATKKMLLLE